MFRFLCTSQFNHALGGIDGGDLPRPALPEKSAVKAFAAG
jgi:hypothetical protein